MAKLIAVAILTIVLAGAAAAQGTPVRVADGQDVNAGRTTDAAVTTDITATLAAKLRGLIKILNDIWDDANNRVRVNVENPTIAVTGPLTDTQLRATPVPVSGTVATGGLTDTQLRATPVPVSGTVTANAGTGTLAVSGPLTDTQLRATPVPVSGTVTVTDGAGALNVIVDSGTTTVTQGTGTNLHAVLDATSTTAVTQATGTNLHAVVDSGTITTVTTLTGITNALPAGTNGIGKLTANTGVIIGDVNVVSSIPGTGATNLGKAEDVAATDGATGVAVLGKRHDTNAQTTTANDDYAFLSLDAYGAAYSKPDHPNRFSCVIQAATVMTQCLAAPGAGLRAFVTGVHLSNQAASVQTLDVVYGTGANCATSPIAMTHKWQMGTLATTTSPQAIAANFSTPLVPAAANAICVRPSAATAFGATITGFIAP